jgi:MoxR-like ATPase
MTAERTIDLGASSAGPLDAAGAASFQQGVRRITDAVNGFLQGKAEVVDLAMICLLSEGHLLLEDVPGVGKTSLARSLAAALGAPWQRIQFTPDLLPSDVTGVSVFHSDSNSFVFHPGPVFANVVLADEINRASPRTQSALLEVMEERQVTIDGKAHHAPRPFLVMATQNPVEMDGTYPLPEAQLDRFLIKTEVGYPDLAAEIRVLQASHRGHGLDGVPEVSSAREVARLIALAGSIHVSDEVFGYIAALTASTRTMPELRLGSSPRGALGLLRTIRVRAALEGRTYATPGDVQAMAVPVLAHRLLPSASFEASGGTTADAVREAVLQVPAPPVSRRT